jgi:hypothetical protein
MVTPAMFGACMGKTEERLDAMGAQLVGINQRLDQIDACPGRWLYVGLLLGVLLIVAQVDPVTGGKGQLSPNAVLN